MIVESLGRTRSSFGSARIAEVSAPVTPVPAAAPDCSPFGEREEHRSVERMHLQREPLGRYEHAAHVTPRRPLTSKRRELDKRLIPTVLENAGMEEHLAFVGVRGRVEDA